MNLCAFYGTLRVSTLFTVPATGPYPETDKLSTHPLHPVSLRFVGLHFVVNILLVELIQNKWDTQSFPCITQNISETWRQKEVTP
jgi:hypothetical protein